MTSFINQWIAGFAVIAAIAASSPAQRATAALDATPAWRFECSGSVPYKLCWQTKAGESYDLWHSDDLANWIHVEKE